MIVVVSTRSGKMGYVAGFDHSRSVLVAFPNETLSVFVADTLTVVAVTDTVDQAAEAIGDEDVKRWSE